SLISILACGLLFTVFIRQMVGEMPLLAPQSRQYTAADHLFIRVDFAREIRFLPLSEWSCRPYHSERIYNGGLYNVITCRSIHLLFLQVIDSEHMVAQALEGYRS